MGIINRINNLVRKNVSTLSPTEYIKRGNYVSPVIKKRLYDYYNIRHRRAVCMIDSVGKKLTHEWAERATAKTFKFYSSHEVDGVEIMQDQRARWEELNCNEIFKSSIVPMVQDGFTLLDLKKEEEAIDYNVYGEYESSPNLWTRTDKNRIVSYKVQYTPQPRAIGSTGSAQIQISTDTSIDNLRAINETYKPEELIHIEYGKPNSGCGVPLIEGAWDSIIKLAIESHQDMLDRRSIPTLDIDEEDVDADNEKVNKQLKMVANSDQDTARVWVHKKPGGQGEPSIYPIFSMKSATSDQGNTARAQNPGISTGDYGNVSKEWARLTTVTGYSINHFMGNRAGATTGSETDKANDDEQEIISFGQIEIVIRKILEWLEANDLITMPTEPYVIKYWKDWERIELLAKNKEDMKAGMLLGGETTKPTDDKEIEPIDAQDNEPKENKINQAVFKELIKCMTINMSYAMTDVSSSWINFIGYDDRTDKLFMMTVSGVVYSKPAPMGEWSFEDWEASASKGRYFWDYLSQRDPAWQKDSIPAHLKTHFILPDVDNFTKENLDDNLYDNFNGVKIPILDYNLIDSVDTETKIKKLGRETDWSMGTGTATHIKKMLNSLKKKANKHQLRHNTMNAEAFGNSIKENHPLLYDIGNGVIVEEYICPDSWKENVGKIVPLGVYHNLDSYNTPELPDWQIVGDAEIFGWDDIDGSDYVKYNFDYDMIDSVFNKIDQYNWLSPVLKENGTSDISTAYYCDIDYKWNESLKKIIRVQTNIELVSISFVPRGNCPGEVCSIKVIAKNMGAIQTYIQNCINEGEEKELCLASAYKKFKATV